MPTVQRLPFEAFVVAAEFIGDRAVFALGDGTVRLLSGSAAEQINVHSGAILTAIGTVDGSGLVSGGDDGRVVLTGPDGAFKVLAERPRKWIDQLAVGPGGEVAYTVGRDAVVRLADGTERTFTHERSVTGLAFAPKGLRLAASRYNGVSLWWANRDAEPVEMEWTGAHIGVTLSPDGRFVVTAMQENAMHGWKLPEGTHMRMTGYPAKPRSLSWSARGRYLASSGADAAVVWPFHFKDGPQGKQPLQLGAREAFVTQVACHPKDELVAIGYRDGAVAIGPFDGATGSLLREPGDGPVSALAWDRPGKRLAFGTEEGAAGVFDLTP
ncbi:MAG: WD40 repeat domain-containing protein [Alphaproteobacteria bacterium]